MLHKKEDSAESNNYKDIALINSIWKLFTHILYLRLRDYVKTSILCENQIGFRTGRRTINNLVILMSTIHIRLRLYKACVYVIFIDFKWAFDSVIHALLCDKLYKIGASVKMIRLIKKLYSTTKICFKNLDNICVL